MARAIWTGVITFGLVTVPVGLYSATDEHEVEFHQFQKGTSDRIRYKRVNERTGKEVPYGDIVKGHDVGDGQYVMVDPDELDAVAPGRTRSLEIHAFVDLDDIDPIYFQKTYFLAPSAEETAKTYALLREAMEKTNRAAIGSFVMRRKEYLVAIRPHDDVLLLETMFFADEVRDPRRELETLPSDAKYGAKEREMAQQLIMAMSDEWRPSDYSDTYQERVRELIEAKRKGREVVLETEAPAPTNVVDLMSVLRESVEAARRGRPSSTEERPSDRKQPAKEPDAALADATKAELSEFASELGIAGRSKMTRDELEKAVAKARSGARRKKKAS